MLPSSYTVTFRSNYGANDTLYITTVTAPATTLRDFPGNPFRSGYDFAGWNTTASGAGAPFTTSTTVNSNMTVYARWTETPPGSYTVTFLMNDGTSVPWEVKILTPPATTIADLPGNPTRIGYAFAGWYTAPGNEGTLFTDSTTVKGDINIWAHWTTIPPYLVTFMPNDGTETSLAKQTVIAPATTVDTADFPANPSRSGYNFGGWNTAANGLGTTFDATTTVSSDITVYAKWDTYSYTITFNNNGGDTAANPATKIVASPALTVDTLPVKPAKTGYAFAGWNTRADGSGALFTEATTVNGGITVYALWSRTTITLNPDAGNETFAGGNFTLSKSATGNPDSRTISIGGADYTSPRWLVDGSLKGTDTSIIIRAADYSRGVHHLSLLVNKSGVTWSKDIAFTVTN